MTRFVLVISFFLLTGIFLVANAASVSTGSHSFSSQLTAKKRKAIESLSLSLYDEKVYGSWSEDSEEFSLIANGICADSSLESSTLLQMVQRILKGSELFSDSEEKTKIALDMNMCVIELPGKMFGKNTYIIKSPKDSIEVSENIDDDALVEVEYWSPKLDSTKTNKMKVLPKSLRLKTSITLGRGEINVIISTSSTGLSNNALKKIIKINKKFWQSRLERELQVTVARNKQLKQQTIVSKNIEKVKTAKRLDRIAYPEKYKQQSPSVRKEGIVSFSSSSSTSSGSSGNGRYKPGAAAAARKVMQKGG